MDHGADRVGMFREAATQIDGLAVDGVRLFNSIAPEQLAAYADSWLKNDFLMVSNALTPEAIDLINKNVTFNDQNAVNDPRQFHRVHNDESSHHFIHHKFLDISRRYYEIVLNVDLIVAYAFAMKYIKNSDMDAHYDNFNNPVSSTVCYHFTPENLSNPIYVDRAKFSNPYTMRLTIKDREGIPRENVVTMDLHPGDIAIFRGRNHLHWRDAVANEMDYRALLLHFCDYKYKGKLIPGGEVENVVHGLVDLDSYDEFRQKYAMYFETNGSSWT